MINYIGQLRLYSYVDLILLWLALRAPIDDILRGTLLWIGFLIHLEWQHRDRGRRPWPAWAWVVPWAGAMALGPSASSIAFLAMAVLYAFKKRVPQIAAVSFLYNGGLKVALAYVVADPSPTWAAAIFALMSLRNLCGDFRDIVKDGSEGVRTLPVRLGVQTDHPLLYPFALAATSILWTWRGSLPLGLLLGSLLIEIATYRLTPR